MTKYNFIGCESDFAAANVVILGAPFDGTTSYRPGARFAPSQIRIESVGIETYSPYFDADLTDFNICDYGDVDMPFGTTNKALELMQKQAHDILRHNKKLLLVGGEHLVSLPAIMEAAIKYDDLTIIHFDAHSDLRQDYIGESLSHATVIRRAWDMLGDNRIWQFGIRSGTREEFYWAKDGHTTLTMHNFYGLAEAINDIGDRPVYLTIDLDVLDPSILPGTGTPEAGGVSFLDLIGAIKEVSRLNIVASDVVELSPHYDHSGSSTAVACKVIRELAIAMSI